MPKICPLCKNKTQGLIINCAICKKRLTEPGALLFKPTDDPELFRKIHICRECDSVDTATNIRLNKGGGT